MLACLHRQQVRLKVEVNLRTPVACPFDDLAHCDVFALKHVGQATVYESTGTFYVGSCLILNCDGLEPCITGVEVVDLERGCSLSRVMFKFIGVSAANFFAKFDELSD